MTNRVALDDKELHFLFEASHQGTHCIRSKFNSFATSLFHLFKLNTKNSFEIKKNFEYLRSNSTIFFDKNDTLYNIQINNLIFVMEIIFVLNSLPILNSNSTIYLIKVTLCTIFKLIIKYFVSEIIIVLNSLPILNSN